MNKRVILARERIRKKRRKKIVLLLTTILFVLILFRVVFLREDSSLQGTIMFNDDSITVTADTTRHDLEPSNITHDTTVIENNDIQENEILTESEYLEDDNSVSENIKSIIFYFDETFFDFKDTPTAFLPSQAQDAISLFIEAIDDAWRINNQFSETAAESESLSQIFLRNGIEPSNAATITNNYPELKKLKSGQQLFWILDKNDQISFLNWLVSDKEERIYQLQDDGSYSREILTKVSEWRTEVVKGEIQGSLATSLNKHSISSKHTRLLSNALQWQINLRQLQAGDKFAVLITREYLGDKLTGQARVEGIHIISRGKSYYAILAPNGNYYNIKGETTGRGFARYPLSRQPRISSHFNLQRKHPVTRRIAPHKGVDFAISTGTPIIAPGDGQVIKVAYQANGAGHYIVIQHGQNYKTVYMHLSRPLVKVGQQVRRGDRIALSGNTGRSTGPHLHYEFHINNRAVNPMTVKLPGNNAVLPESQRRAFLSKAKKIEKQLAIN